LTESNKLAMLASMKAKEIGTFEAKNRLSELIVQVERGQRIYITRRGRRVALLCRPDEEESAGMDPSRLLERIREFRSSAGSGPESLKQLIEEGR
jgi:antitoxin (DNA-binding transcriptional repressor) of toxin-antitoxin stability system